MFGGQKTSMALLVAAVVGTGSYFLPGLPTKAQQADVSEVSCEPDISTGRANCEYSDGIYKGQIVNKIPNGDGVYVFSNGARYDGEFRNGVAHGRGVYISGNDTRYEGVFRNGSIVRGTIQFPDGGSYEGTFSQKGQNNGKPSSRPSGQGTFEFANGDVYQGEFFAGQPFGNGTLRRSNGTVCRGEFYNQNLNANNAVCEFPNGATYRGELKGGVPHDNNGVLIGPRGERFQGRFRDGQPVGENQI